MCFVWVRWGSDAVQFYVVCVRRKRKSLLSRHLSILMTIDFCALSLAPLPLAKSTKTSNMCVTGLSVCLWVEESVVSLHKQLSVISSWSGISLHCFVLSNFLYKCFQTFCFTQFLYGEDIILYTFELTIDKRTQAIRQNKRTQGRCYDNDSKPNSCQRNRTTEARKHGNGRTRHNMTRKTTTILHCICILKTSPRRLQKQKAQDPSV